MPETVAAFPAYFLLFPAFSRLFPPFLTLSRLAANNRKRGLLPV
jgi:hypothetical protein